MFDKILNAIIAFFVKMLLAPKVYYAGEGKGLLDEPSIIISNHTGHMDGPVINTVFYPKRIRTLAAKDRFEQRVMGFFLRHTYCIPIDRQRPDTSWMHESLKILKVDKQNVAIYPEGRHGEHRKQLPFHAAVTTLPVIAGVPIVLVYIDGPVRFFHRNGMIISDPITIERKGMDADFVASQTEMLQEKIKQLMEQYIALTEGPRQ